MAKLNIPAALLALAAFSLAAAAVLMLPLAAPAQGRYCEPLIYRDQLVVVGYQAVIRAAPGCTKPAQLRKESWIGGNVLNFYEVPVGEVKRVWLFTHRLSYTLDGKTWKVARVR